MNRIRLVLTIAVATVTMVLFFAVPALAYGPRGLIGEGKVDIREGQNSILQPGRASQAIQEGRADIRQGQRGIGGH
jgi:hypothetical protein